MSTKSKHIGVVACSVEGAALCFREIAAYSRKLMGEHLHPQVTLSCIAMGEWLPAFNRGDYEGVAEFMLRETQIVAKAGAAARPSRSAATRATPAPSFPPPIEIALMAARPPPCFGTQPLLRPTP